jgi:azurin
MQLLCVLSLSVALMPGPQAAAKPAPKPAAAQPQSTTAKPAAAPAAKGARTVELTASDDMKFNTTTIEAKPGETLHIVLKSVGTMPKIAMAHNFVLLSAAANVDEFIKASMGAQATDYIPPDKKAQVLASTKLAGPGETVETTVKVPAKAGSYPYMCPVPGHYAAGMKGTLVVK